VLEGRRGRAEVKAATSSILVCAWPLLGHDVAIYGADHRANTKMYLGQNNLFRKALSMYRCPIDINAQVSFTLPVPSCEARHAGVVCAVSRKDQ